jgi:hypothetical protein
MMLQMRRANTTAGLDTRDVCVVTARRAHV